MDDAQWFLALSLATRHLSNSAKINQTSGPDVLDSDVVTWCSWTTFPRLSGDAGYWTGPIPQEFELTEDHTTDGGSWSQPFPYGEIAHLIIPRHFDHEVVRFSELWRWEIEQDVSGLAELFASNGIPHRLSDYALEIKLY